MEEDRILTNKVKDFCTHYPWFFTIHGWGCAHIYASVVLYVLTEHNILCCSFTTPRWVAEFPHHSGGTAANAGQKLHWSWPSVQHEYRWRLRLPRLWNNPQQFLQCLCGLDPILCYKTKQGGHLLALRMKCLILEIWWLFIWISFWSWNFTFKF